jgi:hypothetical protein
MPLCGDHFIWENLFAHGPVGFFEASVIAGGPTGVADHAIDEIPAILELAKHTMGCCLGGDGAEGR